MLANMGTPIPGLLYSSVQRREREQKKQKRTTEEKEEAEKETAGTGGKRIETYCQQEMNFYDIYFKSFFHRGRYPLPRREPSAKNQDPSSLLANIPDVETFSGTNCTRSIGPLPGWNNLHLNNDIEEWC